MSDYRFATALPADVGAALRVAAEEAGEDADRVVAAIATPLGEYSVRIAVDPDWRGRNPAGPWYVRIAVSPPEGSRVPLGACAKLLYDLDEAVEETLARMARHYAEETRARATEALARSFGVTPGGDPGVASSDLRTGRATGTEG